MEEKYRCKLCSRSFINGRALGGHMKSYMMNLYAARKDPFDSKMKGAHDDSHNSNSTYSSTSDDENYEEDSSFDAVGSVVLQDRESETDSSKKKYPSRRRSKRVGRSRTCDFERMEMEGFFQVKKSKCFEEEKGKNASIHCSSYVENEPVSSILDATSEEDVAYCLIMLSKDKWERDHKLEYRARIQKEKEKRSEDDYSEEFQKVTRSNKVRGKYKCEACDKLFRSYQALGGHRANHKKIGMETGRSENSGGGSKAAVVSEVAVVLEEKIHECPFCPRVFKSGQALGGHKRTHFLGISRNHVVKSTTGPLMTKPYSRIGKNLNIDLNLPAPFNDDN
ncbi:zinc finger protein ZAT9-like [Primulina huaijiensis]|uniref:zinc finger protein ZAT9-like n=2 Tax=Primulina huaijiensis TaxID=1492673 RepID=UPI003CC76745